MSPPTVFSAALCALCLAATGCGDQDGPPSSRQTSSTTASAAPAPEDKRGIALLCIRDEKGIDARAVGDQTIQIGPGSEGPRIDFYQSSLEAEGEQFEGRAEGASQIGAALLYLKEAPEEQLIELEDCLNEQ